jgi:hypothetical protein
LKRQELKDEAVLQITTIVRGADTHRFNLAAQAAGLWAISAGFSVNYSKDQEQLAIGLKIYYALYSWAKFAQGGAITGNNKRLP